MPRKIEASVTVDPLSLETKPALATKIAMVCTHWAEIEHELMLIYAQAVQLEPAIAAMAFGRINSLPARLDMISDALRHGVSIDSSKEFQGLQKEIWKCSKLRSDVVHSVGQPTKIIRIS